MYPSAVFVEMFWKEKNGEILDLYEDPQDRNFIIIQKIWFWNFSNKPGIHRHNIHWLGNECPGYAFQIYSIFKKITKYMARDDILQKQRGHSYLVPFSFIVCSSKSVLVYVFIQGLLQPGPQLSRKITGFKKFFKTWDLYQSILYTLKDCFM